ncbi:TRAP transporter permease [Mesorhizobium sp. J428]|uniref:TRAP transporter permease n=1 Tax=Mesorhizobium sp. J428 TaxID=2898440 RepID=UPI0035B435BA
MKATQSDIEDYAIRAEFGQRAHAGAAGRVVAAVALVWSLFQLWYASPLPFVVGFGMFNDAQARLIHLAFALFLAFAISPAWSRYSERVPAIDWLLGLVGAGTCLFGLYFFQAQAMRAGLPSFADLGIGAVGILLVLEATRRSMGPFLVLVAVVFLAYCWLGPFMPEVIQHRGASLTRIIEHQWLSSQGIFGVPLGASATFVFVYVLFGTVFNQAGAGNYIMQLSLAFLGHLRGGPAKVAVVSSGLNGLISGSSLANVVASGIFTIPLMKKTGVSGVKAGAIETSASINGQIMPPVMGAAAFIMVEYVGIPYAEVVRHAFLPAVISYIAFYFIAHIEALKTGIEPLRRAGGRSIRGTLLRYAFGTSATIVVVGAIYYALDAVAFVSGSYAPAVLGALVLALYVGGVALSARYPDLPPEDPDVPLTELPNGWEVTRTGLHLLLPVVVLVWCLMIVQMSPGLAAFWATVSAMAIMVSQEPLKRLIRRQDGLAPAFAGGCRATAEALVLGARNMVGVALATATAGLIVGTITLTGLGLMMTDAIGLLSGGNIYFVLLLTALVTLVIGCGVPTTANYVLVATLMAPVIVELGSEAGLAIPLIGVHLFVFYFGIMADATPPVGLGSYAAAAISGESPIATGVQASIYGLRTAALAFVMIFNPEIMLIGIESIWHGLIVTIASIAGCLAFTAATMHYWLVRSRLWETLALLVVALALIYPAGFFDLAYEKYREVPATELATHVEAAPAAGRLVVRFTGTTIEGQDITRLASLRLGPQAAASERLAFSGLQFSERGERLVVSNVAFGSYAARLRIEPGFELAAVLVPTERPSNLWVYAAGMLLLGAVGLMQVRRRRAGIRP